MNSVGWFGWVTIALWFLTPYDPPALKGLAGFSTESDPSGSFCQIVKELVDNAVDSLEGGEGEEVGRAQRA